MSLPKFLATHRTITVEGQDIDIRSLSRAEVGRIRKMADDGASLADLEIAVLAGGTDTPIDEVKAWYEDAPSPVVDPIIAAIRELSRVEEEGAQKSS